MSRTGHCPTIHSRPAGQGLVYPKSHTKNVAIFDNFKICKFISVYKIGLLADVQSCFNQAASENFSGCNVLPMLTYPVFVLLFWPTIIVDGPGQLILCMFMVLHFCRKQCQNTDQEGPLLSMIQQWRRSKTIWSQSWERWILGGLGRVRLGWSNDQNAKSNSNTRFFNSDTHYSPRQWFLPITFYSKYKTKPFITNQHLHPISSNNANLIYPAVPANGKNVWNPQKALGY